MSSGSRVKSRWARFVMRIRVPRAFDPRHREGQIAGAVAGNKRHHVSMEWLRGMLAMAGKIRLAVRVRGEWEEHTSELPQLNANSYDAFGLNKKKDAITHTHSSLLPAN